ncbi:efflux RND transporter periplasmic adaptor subunit [Falsihalocynthiibacter sp. SS001]|uniref:efflux RND transporter periplasmic adaptor subunit n=1 Tax=Falsihalocynthiibacter sp. SS001 TaxID=3349698 RepID=UPI0036D3ADAC
MVFNGRSLGAAFVLGTTLAITNVAYAQDTPASPKVAVAAAYMDELTQEASFIGRGEAIDKVDLVARVTGFILEQKFQDGALVKEGDQLYQIEEGTYTANLAAREADHAQAVANLKLSEVELDRKTELFNRQAGTAADRDIAIANNEVAQAQVDVADTAIKLAELDVSYTKVMAPFDGRVGRSAVSKGELVSPGSGPLVTLIREQPIFVEFSLTEKQLIQVRNAYSAEAVAAEEGAGPAVTVTLPDGSRLDEIGRLDFADNRIDPSTGTITVRAIFENEELKIIDGSFLTVQIASEEPTEALMIPLAAVQRDQRGDFVLVVGAQQTVEQRYVTLAQHVETAVVVEEGLREGETVIVEGLQRVRPGVAVEAIVAGTATETVSDDATADTEGSSDTDEGQ